MQAVRIALEETISLVANKRANEVVVEYITAVALFQLRSKPTLFAIKVIEEPGQWNARVCLDTYHILLPRHCRSL